LSLDIPRHWFPHNPFASWFLNAYTVLVPANESFYIRTRSMTAAWRQRRSNLTRRNSHR